MLSHGIEGKLFILKTRICFHSFLQSLTFSLFFDTSAIHSFICKYVMLDIHSYIQYVMLDIIPGTKENNPWTSVDIYLYTTENITLEPCF